MRNKFLLLFWAVILATVTVKAETEASAPTSGDGSESSPYEIASLANLKWLSENSGNWGYFFKQTANIDASETADWNNGGGFEPIGTSETAFTGNYNGAGYIIDGLYINYSNDSNVGLFGYTEDATIDNLGVSNCSITGYSEVGGLVGYASSSSISECYAIGNVSGDDWTGGLLGGNESSTVSKCYANVSVTGEYNLGGLVGYNMGAITNCYSVGSVVGEFQLGGLAGFNTSTISYCYSTGLVSGTEENVEGLVGVNNSNITDSYYNSETSGQSDSENGTPLTTSEMKESLSFSTLDFEDTWEITDNTTFPRLQGVDDYPVLLQNFITVATVGEEYTDTVHVVQMDADVASVSLEKYPEGMTVDANNIISWTPSETGTDTVAVKILDINGQQSSFSFEINVISLSGSGTEGDPLLISSLDDLKALSETSILWNQGYYFKQTADIDATGTQSWNDGDGFSPIGNSETAFTGNYNGAGYTIDGLYIYFTEDNYAGLFGYVKESTIDSLGLVNSSVKGDYYVGGLAGYIYSSTIGNCYVTGDVTGSGDVGGLIGVQESSSSISKCYSAASVTGSEYQVGGLVGETYSSTINDSYSTGSVSGSTNIGGLVGYNSSTISDCYSVGQVFGSGSEVGGLIGANNSTVNDSYYNSSTSGQSEGIGNNSYNNQTVTGLTTSEMEQTSSFDSWDFEDTWEITAEKSFPRLQGLVDYPVVLQDIVNVATVDEEYTDTINVIQMDAAIESVSLLKYPEGMTMDANNIISWIPSVTGTDSVIIKVIDANGLTCSYSFEINILTIKGSGSEDDPFLISSLEDLKGLSENSFLWTGSYYFKQTADIDASETSEWNDGDGFTPIGNLDTAFKGNYNGAGFTIDGLYENYSEDDYFGLFGYVNKSTIDSLGITNCSVTGMYEVGALAGSINSSTVNNSYATGSVSGFDYVGGLIGENSESSTISKCYASVSVSGSDYSVGGLVGSNMSTVEDCYATGSVDGEANQVGGLVGSNSSTISNCYSVGKVSCSGDQIGALVGYSYSIVSNSYYNSETSGQEEGIGQDENDQTVTGLTSSEMKQSANFDSWDFDDTWEILAGITFPRLQNIKDYPVILTDYKTFVSVNEEYVDTIRAVQMDAELSDVSLLEYPDGMTVDENNIISWTPSETGSDTITISITDADGLKNSYSYVITVLSFSGSGTEDDPYKIASLTDLQMVSDCSDLWDAYFVQTEDINAAESDTINNGDGFSSIGNNSVDFKGTYDGAGYTIDSLYIDNSGDYIGFFGCTKEATIDSLGLTNCSVSGDYKVGALIGYAYSSAVSNCYSTGSVSGTSDNVGGLVGYAYSSNISNCYTAVSVTGSGTCVGGLAGYVYSTPVSNSYATGSVTGTQYIGGLVGRSYSSSTITNCYATGFVSGESDAGGLIGYNYATVSNSYFNSETSNQTEGIGYDNKSQTVSGVTISEMKLSATFASWDFDDTWEIEEGTTLPRLQGLSDIPVIFEDFNYIGSIDEVYKDTIRYVRMDAAVSDISLFNYPDGMTLQQDTILTWTPSEVGNDTVTIKITDVNGGVNVVSYIINVAPEGSGTEDDPYQIASLSDLRWLSESSDYWDKYFIQTADIDASESEDWNDGEGFSSIGNSDTKFSGNYNGAGYTIDGLYMNYSSSYVGLFGYAYGATIDSIGLTNCSVSGRSTVGGLVGYAKSSTKISNCYVVGSIVGNGTSECYNIGGLVGRCYNSTVSDSYSSGSVSMLYNPYNEDDGGLIGYVSESTISNCYSTCSVLGGSSSYSVGGLIGDNYYSTVKNSYATGSVSAENKVGGLVGYNEESSTFTNCYSTGFVSGSDYLGGLCGKNYGELTNCYYNKETSKLSSAYGEDDNNQDDNYLSTDQMTSVSAFSAWDIVNSTDGDHIWRIIEGETYPVLDSVSNNAPFAFADTLDIGRMCQLDTVLLVNDYDYETGQASLVLKVDSLPEHGSYSNGVLTFDSEAVLEDDFVMYYSVGELIAEGDTLWGNQAVAKLTLVNSAPVITSVATTSAIEGVEYTYEVEAADADGDELTYSLNNAPAGMTISDNVITWTPGDGVTTSGDVTVIVSDGNLSDSEVFTITVGSATGISIVSANKISVYPNPATSIIYVEGGRGVVSIYNIAGKKVLTNNLSNNNRIDISELDKGIYILNVDGENIKVIKK